MVQKALMTKQTSPRMVTFCKLVYHLFEYLALKFVPESFRQKDVTGQVILITGAGSGIGQLMAIKFLRLGAKVVIWDINDQGLKETVRIAKDQGLDTTKIFSYKINLCEPQAIYDTAKRVKSEVGIVDILINNAGVVSGTSFLDTPDEKIRLTFNVNVMAHFYTLKAFLPDMVTRNSGHIVTIASVAGSYGVSGLFDYCSSKFANVGMDLSLRAELAHANLTGIKTTVVRPYFITTGMFEGANPGLLPYLKPQQAVDGIVSGVLAERHNVTLPGMFTFLLPLSTIIPAKALADVYDFLGGFEFMTSFQGRGGHGSPKPVEQSNGTGKNSEINNNTALKKDN